MSSEASENTVELTRLAALARCVHSAEETVGKYNRQCRVVADLRQDAKAGCEHLAGIPIRDLIQHERFAMVQWRENAETCESWRQQMLTLVRRQLPAVYADLEHLSRGLSWVNTPPADWSAVHRELRWVEAKAEAAQVELAKAQAASELAEKSEGTSRTETAGDASGTSQPAGDLPDGASTGKQNLSGKTPRTPTEQERQCYNLHGLGWTQKQIALELFGTEKKQGQVSRAIQAVRDYHAAGGLNVDDVLGGNQQPSAPASVDPKTLDTGERADGRTKRQRARRRDDE